MNTVESISYLTPAASLVLNRVCRMGTGERFGCKSCNFSDIDGLGLLFLYRMFVVGAPLLLWISGLVLPQCSSLAGFHL